MRSRHNNENAEDQAQAMQHPHDDSLCFNISLHLGPSRKGSEESKHSIGGKRENQHDHSVGFHMSGPKKKERKKKEHVCFHSKAKVQNQTFKHMMLCMFSACDWRILLMFHCVSQSCN